MSERRLAHVLVCSALVLAGCGSSGGTGVDAALDGSSTGLADANGRDAAADATATLDAALDSAVRVIPDANGRDAAADAAVAHDHAVADANAPDGGAATDGAAAADATDAGVRRLPVGVATGTAWATLVTQVGQPAVSRLYSTGMPSSFSGYHDDNVGVLQTVLSVKPPNGVASYTATSTDGVTFASLIASLPQDGRQWRVAIFHEPEDNVASGDFTAPQWRAMQIVMGGQIHALGRADVKSCVIFQSFTFLAAGAAHHPPRNPADWWEAGMDAAVDFIYFDAYPDLNSGSPEFTTLEGQIKPTEDWARSQSKPFGFTEFAVNDKTGDPTAKPAMLSAMIAREQANPDCDNLIYFDVKGAHYNVDPSYLLQSDTGSGPAWAAGMSASF